MARPIQMNPITGRVDDPDASVAPVEVLDQRVQGGPAGVANVNDPFVAPSPFSKPSTGAGLNEPTDMGDNDVDTMNNDQVGDIPPPPIPDSPRGPTITGPGIAGIPGTEAGTFARPGSQGALAFRSPAFVPKGRPRFGPGVANVGGGQSPLDAGAGLGLSPDEAAELLKGLAGGRGGF